MEREQNPEWLNDPGKRFMREVEMLMTDSERKDLSEILSSVGSELPRELDAALEAGALSDAQKAEALRDLKNIREDVSRLPDSDDKKLIMNAFEALLRRLA